MTYAESQAAIRKAFTDLGPTGLQKLVADSFKQSQERNSIVPSAIYRPPGAGGDGSGLNPAIIIGGVAVLGLGVFFFIRSRGGGGRIRSRRHRLA